MGHAGPGCVGWARPSGGPTVFPNAACVVTLVDRLLHRSELIAIDGSSYRLEEATERAATKAKTRAARRKA